MSQSFKYIMHNEKYVMQLVLILTEVLLLLHSIKHKLKFRGNQVYQRRTEKHCCGFNFGEPYNVHIL